MLIRGRSAGTSFREPTIKREVSKSIEDAKKERISSIPRGLGGEAPPHEEGERLHKHYPSPGRWEAVAPQPLAGIRVLDLTRLLPGPFLTQVLADLGADVVKVEEPGTGDYARWIPPEVDGAGYPFAATNRGKRSIAVNLKSAEGVEVVKRLATASDVLLESFRPGVLDKVGLSDSVLEALNPRLVRASLVGYGPGDLRDEPGHDLNYEAMAGILEMQGSRHHPMVGAVLVADLAGAMYGATGVLAALVERARTGRGQRVEVALADAALAFNSINLLRAAGDAPLPARGEWELTGGIPGYRLYECADGRHLALGTLEPKFWTRFVEAVREPELEPLHMDASPEAHARVEALFRSRPADEWAQRLRKAGVPATPVLTPDEARRRDPRFGGRPGPGSPLTGRGSAGRLPNLGEDTDEVLREAGYSEADAARLRASGAVA